MALRAQMPISIDFRKENFGDKVNALMNEFERVCFDNEWFLLNNKVGEMLDLTDQILIELYDALLIACGEAYSHQSQEDILHKANFIFSQYLQNLVYFLSHAAINYNMPTQKALMTQVFLQLINRTVPNLSNEIEGDNIRIFFYKGYIWIDPKTGFTVFNSICVDNFKGIFAELIKELEYSFEHIQEMRDFFSHQTNAGFTALQNAAAQGRISMFEKISDEAKRLFNGERTFAFKKFIELKTKTADTLLHLAVSGKYLDVVQAVIKLIHDVYGKDNNNLFAQPFFHATNKKGETPYALAKRLAREEADPIRRGELNEIRNLLHKYELKPIVIKPNASIIFFNNSRKRKAHPETIYKNKEKLSSGKPPKYVKY